jgi:hypothetical protein
MGTGFDVVLVTCTSTAATPRAAFGASAATNNAARKIPPRVDNSFRTWFIGFLLEVENEYSPPLRRSIAQQLLWRV